MALILLSWSYAGASCTRLRLGPEGVVVTGVDSDGIAADHGFSTGDVILEIAGKSVSTPADVRDVVSSARTEGKRSVLIRVKKGDNTRFVALPIGNG
jgi:serine protease Do